MQKKKRSFTDTLLIYESERDKCWLAHSLRTDQVGMGACWFEALTDGIKAIDGIIALAEDMGDIAVLRNAPENIQEMARRAKELPEEICEIARKKLYGKWPDYVKVTIDLPQYPYFTTSLNRHLYSKSGNQKKSIE